ncbi:MAG: GntR family transcriptional regulator [Paracoccus sp. (in: a-proteobacteria)]|uniref:GntR family transcriptional regulator n=1 Tax=Paracoccus sp. TaxID=267 RepID=UPI0026DEB571|nr:GntR family transcriptional regulator [Paracoccus sp. (in: a-proteobacteria)]MDO5611814.1 GntR family transcriptional regulator [Paracoccus sp. (in: a-proteobacteria)]
MNTWQSVRAEVLDRIRSGKWAPGELIPTEQELAVELGCARATVNRALRELADSGIVERRRKVGTRVTTTPSRRTVLEISVIRQEIEATGAEYGYTLLECGTVIPPEHVALALQIAPDRRVMAARLLYLANGRPHCSETVWLNLTALPPVECENFAIASPHEWLARNVALTHGRFSILAEAAGTETASSLQVPSGTPLLTIERTNWSNTMPVSYSRQSYPPGHRLISED